MAPAWWAHARRHVRRNVIHPLFFTLVARRAKRRTAEHSHDLVAK